MNSSMINPLDEVRDLMMESVSRILSAGNQAFNTKRLLGDILDANHKSTLGAPFSQPDRVAQAETFNNVFSFSVPCIVGETRTQQRE